MSDSDASIRSDVQTAPGRRSIAHRDVRGRIIGLIGVLFYGIWMVFFGVASTLMAVIVVTGADNPAETAFLAVGCAALSVFNGWRLRRPLRRLRGI